MKVCISCEDSKKAEVKETAKSIISADILKIPVSESGELPATHWFCCLTCNDEMYAKLLAVQNHTTIEVSDPKEFLQKWNLKIIM